MKIFYRNIKFTHIHIVVCQLSMSIQQLPLQLEVHISFTLSFFILYIYLTSTSTMYHVRPYVTCAECIQLQISQISFIHFLFHDVTVQYQVAILILMLYITSFNTHAESHTQLLLSFHDAVPSATTIYFVKKCTSRFRSKLDRKS